MLEERYILNDGKYVVYNRNIDVDDLKAICEEIKSLNFTYRLAVKLPDFPARGMHTIEAHVADAIALNLFTLIEGLREVFQKRQSECDGPSAFSYIGGYDPSVFELDETNNTYHLYIKVRRRADKAFRECVIQNIEEIWFRESSSHLLPFALELHRLDILADDHRRLADSFASALLNPKQDLITNMTLN
jgi:hypothetical protein